MNTTQGAQLTKLSRNAGLTSRWLCMAGCLALLAMSLMLVGCDEDDEDTNTQSSQVIIPPPALKADIFGANRIGDHRFEVWFTSNQGGTTLTWTPPPGATDFTWAQGGQPQPGGPPFVWTNLPPSGGNPQIGVYYGYDEFATHANTITVAGGGQSATASTTVTFGGGGSPRALSPSNSAPNRQASGKLAPAALSDTYNVWWVHNVSSVPNVVMTTNLCQQWMNFFQSSATFFALRYPVHPPLLDPTDSYTQPVVFRDVYSPTLRLYAPSRLFTAPMEYRPGRFSFLETQLPSAPGEHWLALGVATTPTITCPAGLNVPGGTWQFETDFQLDFGGAYDANEGRVLALYSCYEGQNAPFFFTQSGWALGGKPRAPAYQGQGITCTGPQPIRLVEYSTPRIEIGNPRAFIAYPPQRVTLDHYVSNYASAPVTVTLSYTSTRGLPWGFYSDAAGTTPLVGPIRLEHKGASGRTRNFFVIADIAAGTPTGLETLTITATDVALPSRSAWTADSVWVGAWVPPPAGNLLYLPLVLR
jgi:hypothetical protein